MMARVSFFALIGFGVINMSPAGDNGTRQKRINFIFKAIGVISTPIFNVENMRQDNIYLDIPLTTYGLWLDDITS